MSMVLGFVYVAAAAALVAVAKMWFLAGRAEVDEPGPDDWGLGGWIDYRLGDWAVETPVPAPLGRHAEPMPAGMPCRCCESTAHTTYWHASR